MTGNRRTAGQERRGFRRVGPGDILKQEEPAMTDYILATGVGVFTVYAAFNIAYLVSMKRTGDRVTGFVRETEGNLNEALRELAGTLENLRRISGNVSAVSDDVRRISMAVANVERQISDALAYLRDRMGDAAEANIAGLRAGITTGVATLVKNLHEGRRDEHESGERKD